MTRPLEEVVLQMKAMGIRDVKNFPFPTQPNAKVDTLHYTPTCTYTNTIRRQYACLPTLSYHDNRHCNSMMNSYVLCRACVSSTRDSKQWHLRDLLHCSSIGIQTTVRLCCMMYCTTETQGMRAAHDLLRSLGALEAKPASVDNGITITVTAIQSGSLLVLHTDMCCTTCAYWICVRMQQLMHMHRTRYYQ
jgi:hypothetical protein